LAAVVAALAGREIQVIGLVKTVVQAVAAVMAALEDQVPLVKVIMGLLVLAMVVAEVVALEQMAPPAQLLVA
jgi:hypothetical protein